MKITKRMKNIFISLCCALLCVVTGLLCSVNGVFSVKAADDIQTTSLMYCDGASIRLADDGKSGIRFHVKLKADTANDGVTINGTNYTYNAETRNFDGLTTGILVIPADKLAGAELTVGETYNGARPANVKDEQCVWSFNTEDSCYEATAYVYNIPETSYDREFTFRGYYTVNGTTYYTVNENNTRCVSNVALFAKKDHVEGKKVIEDEASLNSLNKYLPKDAFEIDFPNTEKYLYRVGNKNSINLQTLFTSVEERNTATAANGTTFQPVLTNVSYSVTIGEDKKVTNTETTEWNKEIDFENDFTGIATISIWDEYSRPLELKVEVVDAENITTATGSNGTDVVLLNNVKISNDGAVTYSNCTVYGNGFTFDVCGGLKNYVSSQGWGIINLNNGAVLDNMVIVGDEYTVFGAYTNNEYNTAAVASDNGVIQNCHISHCAAPVMTRGTTTIKDTTLYGGTVANLIIKGGKNTLENVITANYDDKRAITGMGIVVHSDASDTTKLILNGTLKQYNFYSETDVPTDANAKTLYNAMFADSCSGYHFGTSPERYVNTGVISMTSTFDGSDIIDNANTGYTGVAVTVSGFNGYVYTQPKTKGSVDNNYVEATDTHKATVQGDYLPTFTFDLGDQEISYDGDSDSRYLYGDVNGVTALYQDGESALTLDLTKLATATKHGTNLTVNAVCKDASGNSLTASNGVVTLAEEGEYSLVFTVMDNILYDASGNLIGETVEREYIVSLSLSVKDALIKNAVVNITKTALDGVYTTVNLTDYKLRINFLDCISIKDYDKTGTETAVDLTANISSATLTPSSVNVFTTASTITITYTDGRELTVNLSNISGSSPGTKTATVNTSGGVYFITDGALNDKPTESSSQNKCTITGVSFKGNNGATVTNDTDVTVTWELGSSSSGGTCLAEGTMITLADGTKERIENLRKGNMVMSIDHLTGELTASEVIIVVKTASDFYENAFVFDDGTRLVTINEHGIFDLDLNKYVNIDHENYIEYLGHNFVSVDVNGNIGVKKLINVVSVFKSGYKYDIVTNQTLNYVAEDTLSVTHVLVDVINSFDFGENLKYDQERMQEDIEKYGLYTYDEWEEFCDISVFEEYNIPAMKVGISKGLYTKEYIIGLINTYVLDDSVQILD